MVPTLGFTQAAGILLAIAPVSTFRTLKCSFSRKPSSSNLERRTMIVDKGAFLGMSEQVG